MRKLMFIAVLIVLGSPLAGCLSGKMTGPDGSADTPPVKNIIFMVSDGTAGEAWTMARWVKGGRLASDAILSGAVLTYGADSIITDSAAAATSYATGQKGSVGGIAVAPWHVTVPDLTCDPTKQYQPLATVLEGARLTGRATGIIATSNLQHATPAAFTAHTHDRRMYNEIAEQQVYQEVDVVLSGGRRYLLPEGVGSGVRTDGENLIEAVKAMGYAYVTNREQMLAADGEKIFGLFAENDMAYDLDRALFAPNQPSLAEMTAKALQTLSSCRKGRTRGFFLFVEGSKIDWAAHDNDPAGVAGELLAYDAAVGVALDFARADGNTLLISLADHATGGLSLGRGDDPHSSTTGDDYPVLSIRKAGLTAEGLARLIGKDRSETAVRAKLADHWGITEPSGEEITLIRQSTGGANLRRTLASMLSRRALIGWTTHGHTGGESFLFSYGPGRLTGLWQNSDIGRYMARQLDFSLAEIDKRLFVDGRSAFQAAGFTTRIDRNDAANPVFVVSKDNIQARLPLAKNLLLSGDKTIVLEGIVVPVEELDRVYLPRQAIDIVKARLK